MAPVDVPVGLLGYGTVGAAVNRFLHENAGDIERVTGYRLRVAKALVRDLNKKRDFPAAPGILTTDFAEIADNSEISLVAEVMGGLDPTHEYILRLLEGGKPVVTANKQLLAQRGAELFSTAQGAGVQLRFEASVCAAIPVIKVLRESLVVTNVHRILGIVNGTTNYILTQMELGATYEEALAEAKRHGYAEMDPTEDVSGADAAAKMAILATVAFGSRVTLADVQFEGVEHINSEHVAAARQMDMVIRLIGQATLVDGRYDVRVSPALVDRAHPLASVEGAFNAIMLQGDAIREITLEGPGAGGIETASAVIADMVSIIGTTGTGFLHNDACWRTLDRLPASELRVLHADLGGRPPGRAGPRRRAPGKPQRLGRTPDPDPDRGRRNSSRRLARGYLRGDRRRPRGDPQSAGEPRDLGGLPRHFATWHLGARMDLIEPNPCLIDFGPDPIARAVK